MFIQGQFFGDMLHDPRFQGKIKRKYSVRKIGSVSQNSEKCMIVKIEIFVGRDEGAKEQRRDKSLLSGSAVLEKDHSKVSMFPNFTLLRVSD